jgi:signal peptidase I
MPRYVPKTYNNRRILRLVFSAIVIIALSALILFLILFFVFQRYVVDGQLHIPWL